MNGGFRKFKDLPKEEQERQRAATKALFAKWSDTAIPAGGDFYDTGRWGLLRNKTIQKYGNKCQRCGCENSSANPIQVDHIKPRSKYKELEWDESNLQVLCKACNKEKSNKDETDWRTW